MGTRKAFTKGLTGALSAAPSANPFLIGASALTGAVTGALEDDNPFRFDPNPFREGFKKTARAAQRRARRSGAETFNRSRASAAARGFGGSELSQSVSSGQERAVRQQTDDQLTLMEANLEDNIAHGEAWTDQANRSARNKDLASLGNAAVSTAFNVATTDSPLRKALGIPDVKKEEPYGYLRREEEPKEEAPEETPDDTSTLDKPNTWKNSGDMGTQESTPSREGGNVTTAWQGERRERGAPLANRTPTMIGTSGNRGGGQLQTETPTGTTPTLTANSSKEDINNFLQQSKIPNNSRLGKLFHENPTQLGILADTFGTQWLIDAYSLI